MRDRTGPDPRDGKGTPEPSPCSTWGVNIGEERRNRIVGLVEHRLAELTSRLESEIPGSTLDSGTATCAEVQLDDQEITHRFLCLSLSIPSRLLDPVVGSLKKDGWRPSVPGSDTGIIRIAHRHGRRPMFLMIQPEHDEIFGPNSPAPWTDRGRALRIAMLRRALLPPDVVLAKRLIIDAPHEQEIESLEIQIRAIPTGEE
jgi:hypothetical protein